MRWLSLPTVFSLAKEQIVLPNFPIIWSGLHDVEFTFQLHPPCHFHHLLFLLLFIKKEVILRFSSTWAMKFRQTFVAGPIVPNQVCIISTEVSGKIVLHGLESLAPQCHPCFCMQDNHCNQKRICESEEQNSDIAFFIWSNTEVFLAQNDYYMVTVSVSRVASNLSKGAI